MSETVEKILDYLGETTKKNVVGRKIGPASTIREGATGRFVTVKGVRTKVVAAHKTAVMNERASMRAPQLRSRAVVRLADKLLVSPEVVLNVSDISERTFQRRQANHALLTEAESDRVLRIARVAREAERVFGDSGKASRWLSSESRILGAKPLDLLATDAGARDVEHELVRIEHGDFA